jgi:hypothetical protein
MSALTQFIKDGQIRDPKQLPIMVVAASGGYLDDKGWMLVQTSTISVTNDGGMAADTPYTPFRENSYGWGNNVARITPTASSSYSTILNVTSGGGYLLNVQNTVTNGSGTREQGLRITVDGVVTTYPAFDYGSTHTSFGSNFCTLWGYVGLGSSSSHYSDRDAADSATLRGVSSDQTPRAYTDGVTDFRIFSAQEFKQKKLPALRFEQSCKVELYTTSLYSDRYGPAYCSYYLDSQIF